MAPSCRIMITGGRRVIAGEDLTVHGNEATGSDSACDEDRAVAP